MRELFREPLEQGIQDLPPRFLLVAAEHGFELDIGERHRNPACTPGTWGGKFITCDGGSCV